MVKSCVLTFWYVYGLKSILCYKVFSTVLVIASWSHVVILSWIHLHSHKRIIIRLLRAPYNLPFLYFSEKKFLWTVSLSLFGKSKCSSLCIKRIFFCERAIFLTNVFFNLLLSTGHINFSLILCNRTKQTKFGTKWKHTLSCTERCCWNCVLASKSEHVNPQTGFVAPIYNILWKDSVLGKSGWRFMVMVKAKLLV